MPRVTVPLLCIALLAACAHAMQHEKIARVAVLDLGPGPDDAADDRELDVTGLHIEPDTLREIIPWLEAEHVTHVLFRVNSRGGALDSAVEITELIHTEYNPRFETSAWLIKATGAAPIAMLACERWIAHPSETYELTNGLIYHHSGKPEGVWSLSPDEFVARMISLASPPRSDAIVLDGLLYWGDLSADIDEAGNVTWRADTDGQVLVSSRPDHYPALIAKQMVTLGLAVGAAGSLDEALDLAVPGPREVVATEVNALLLAERRAAQDDREAAIGSFVRYRAAVQLLSSATEEDPATTKAVYHDAALEALEEIVAFCDSRSSLALFVMNMTGAQIRLWVSEQRELLRDLRR